MALMRDKKPVEYAGEQLVWEKLEQNLPQDIICYHHREINGREFDFCLLIPEIGFLIIEVKGWHLQEIEQVKSPDEIILKGNHSVTSPKKQAKSYRFALLNQLQEKYHINPLVMDMVCYPFLNQIDYQKKGLSIVSESEFTIFSDDLQSSAALGRKIINAYQNMNRVAGDKCSGKVYDICRHVFESEPVTETAKSDVIPYSCLSVYTKPLTLAEINRIMQSYFSGIKQILFVNSMEDLTALADNLTELFIEKNIFVSHGNLQFGKLEQPISVSGNKLSIFHFEAIYVGTQLFSESFTVYNGSLSDEQKRILSDIPKKELFNLDQYCIEHAPVGKDIQVRAGAGTGKTYSMVSRIAFLCHVSSGAGVYAPAEEIAMLTFTSDAAVNMKKRLKQMFMNCFGLTKQTKYLELVSDIEKMRISTIHSFANEVLKNTSLALGIGTNFTTVSGYYDRNIIFDRIFDAYLSEKNQESPFFFEELPMSIYDFQKIMHLMPRMLYNKGCDIKEVAPDAFGKPPAEMSFLNDMIEKVIIPTEKEYEHTLAENNAVHLSEYMIYLRKCISFEGFNINLFRFKYIFIDEFQDTDDAQIAAFLEMQKKIQFCFFIVGDLKQSIYRFRGATMDAFQKMGASQWLKYHLTVNYRTDSRVLQKFDTVFSAMGSQKLLPYLPETDTLVGVAQDDTSSQDEIVRCCVYHKEDIKSGEYFEKLFKEIETQKKFIKHKMQNQKLTLPQRTIAILTRTNHQIETILSEARKRNIQIESNAGGDLYQLPSTIDLCKLTAALCNPYHAAYLVDLIHSNNVHVEFDLSMLTGLSETEKTNLLIYCLDEFYKETLGKTWEELIYEVQHKPVLMVLRIIYEGTEPWKRYSNGITPQTFYRANYDLLFEELSQMNKKTYLTLDSVNESLHIAVTTGESREPRTLEMEQEGVRILCTTVHKSKGLEYATVILPFTDKEINSSVRNGLEVTYADEKVGYCIAVNGEQYSNSYYDNQVETLEKMMEESRILYVAMTRAIYRFICFRNIEASKWCWGGLLEEL